MEIGTNVAVIMATSKPILGIHSTDFAHLEVFIMLFGIIWSNLKF